MHIIMLVHALEHCMAKILYDLLTDITWLKSTRKRGRYMDIDLHRLASTFFGYCKMLAVSPKCEERIDLHPFAWHGFAFVYIDYMPRR